MFSSECLWSSSNRKGKDLSKVKLHQKYILVQYLSKLLSYFSIIHCDIHVREEDVKKKREMISIIAGPQLQNLFPFTSKTGALQIPSHTSPWAV